MTRPKIRQVVSSNYKNSYVFIDYLSLLKENPKLSKKIPHTIYKNEDILFQFNGSNIKKLDDRNLFSLTIITPDGEEKVVMATHEWKIDKENRVLLYEIPGDNKQGCLYLGARFVNGGLHTQGKIKAETIANRSRAALEVNWPKDNGNAKQQSLRCKIKAETVANRSGASLEINCLKDNGNTKQQSLRL